MQVLSNGSLSAGEVYMEDSGLYGCTAENSGGPRRTEVHLHVTSQYPHSSVSRLSQLVSKNVYRGPH